MQKLKRGITIFLILTLMLSCIPILPVYATETTIPEMPVDDIDLIGIPTSEPTEPASEPAETEPPTDDINPSTTPSSEPASTEPAATVAEATESNESATDEI